MCAASKPRFRSSAGFSTTKTSWRAGSIPVLSTASWPPATVIPCARPTMSTKKWRRLRRHLRRLLGRRGLSAPRSRPAAGVLADGSTFSDNTAVRLELEVGDRLRTVDIRRRAGGYDVVVDG